MFFVFYLALKNIPWFILRQQHKQCLDFPFNSNEKKYISDFNKTKCCQTVYKPSHLHRAHVLKLNRLLLVPTNDWFMLHTAVHSESMLSVSTSTAGTHLKSGGWPGQL